MTKFPNDDESLVAFIKQHRPAPPPTAANFEEELMELIERQSQPTMPQQQAHSPVFAIPRIKYLIPIASATVAGLFLSWGGYRLLNPSPSIAQLEMFLVNSWNSAIGSTSFSASTETPETYWLLLADLETDFQSSNNKIMPER